MSRNDRDPVMQLKLRLTLTAQEWNNRTPNATNYSIVHFVLMPGSQLSFTEITDYVFSSLVQSDRELQYEVE